MRFSAFLFFSLISYYSSAQKDTDTLKKYTYLIVHYKIKESIDFDKSINSNSNGFDIGEFKKRDSLRLNLENIETNNSFSFDLTKLKIKYDTIVNGLSSGFFIRKKKRLFFVGSYHSFMGVDTYNKQLLPSENRSDVLGIEYYDDSFKKYKYYLLNVSLLNENENVVSLNEYPDVYIYEIKNDLPSNMEIFSVENLVKKSTRKTNPEYSILYGYYYEKTFNSWFNASTQDMRPFLYTGTVAEDELCKNFLPNIDSLNLRLKTFNKWGASGAPVFFKYKKGEKEWIEFAGIQCAGNYKLDCSIVVKKNIFIDLLNNILESDNPILYQSNRNFSAKK